MPVDLKGVFGKMWEMADAYKATTGHTIQKDGMAWLMSKKTWDQFCKESGSAAAGCLQPDQNKMLGCHVITSDDVPAKEVFLVMGSSNKWLQHPSGQPKTPKPKWKSNEGLVAGGSLTWNDVPISGTYTINGGGTAGSSTISVNGNIVNWTAGGGGISSGASGFYVYDSAGQNKQVYANFDLAKKKAQELGGLVNDLSSGVWWKSDNWSLIEMLGGPGAIKVGTHYVVVGGKSYHAHKSSITGEITVSESHPGGAPFNLNNIPKWWKLNDAGTIATVAYNTGETLEYAPAAFLLALKDKASKPVDIIELDGCKYKVWKFSNGAIEVKFWGKASGAGPAQSIKPQVDFAKAQSPGIYSEGQLDNVLSTFKNIKNPENPLLDKSPFTLKTQKTEKAKQETVNAILKEANLTMTINGQTGEEIMSAEEMEAVDMPIEVPDEPPKITPDDLYATIFPSNFFAPSDEEMEDLKKQLKEMPATTLTNKDNNG